MALPLSKCPLDLRNPCLSPGVAAPRSWKLTVVHRGTELRIQGQKALTSWRRQHGVCAAPVDVAAGPQGAGGSGLFSFTTSTSECGSLHPDKSDAQNLSLSLENREPTKPRVASSAKVVRQGGPCPPHCVVCLSPLLWDAAPVTSSLPRQLSMMSCDTRHGH